MILPPSALARLSAGALIRNAAGDVLLGKPTYKPGWELPGGFVEPGETPSAACHRELREELGIDRPPGRLLLAQWAVGVDGVEIVLFVFDGGTMTDAEYAAVVVDGVEIEATRWVAPGALAGHAPPGLARRLALAVDAAHTGGTVYAEPGRMSSATGAVPRRQQGGEGGAPLAGPLGLAVTQGAGRAGDDETGGLTGDDASRTPRGTPDPASRPAGEP